MKSLLLISISVLFALHSFSQKTEKEITFGENDFIIYSVKKGKVVKLETVIKEMKNYDALFFGEEHNDSIAHRIQTALLQMMYKKFGKNTALSMEMFDRDVQYIMDEYLSGTIKQYYFNKDSRKWKNYKDYKPMVEFSKEKELKVICANAPFRYVSVANRGGLDVLMSLSDKAKDAMAPLPYTIASGKYAEKLDGLTRYSSKKITDSTKSDTGKTKKHKMRSFDMKPGQSLWDATMAYSVSQHFKTNPDAKILHLNGRFHTEEYFGIIQRLAEYNPNIKPLVITQVGSEENFPNINFEEYKNLSDYIIFTNPNVVKSY